jgi:hypothetical protein
MMGEWENNTAYELIFADPFHRKATQAIFCGFDLKRL